MKKGIIYNAIKERKVTLFAVIVLALFGIYNYYYSPKEEAPKVNLPIAMINAVYPGASPQEVESMVTAKIEDKVAEIDGYATSSSFSKTGMSTVILELEYGVDVDESWQELQKKVEQLQTELPEGSKIVNVNTNLMKTAGIIISITGENFSIEELNSYAQKIKKEFSKVNGISQVEILGSQDQEIVIVPDVKKLNLLKISLNEIGLLIKSNNLNIPSGSLDDGNIVMNVNTENIYSSIKDIENTIVSISPETGEVLRLKDIANVYEALKLSSYKANFNGDKAILIAGYFKNNENVVLIGQDVDDKINELKENMPDGIDFNKVLYQPDDVNNSVNNFITNLLLGMLLVIIITFVSMGIRNAIIVSTAIPLTILLTFSTMNILGIKFHNISISALIIALGMLVDNAIVISDSIQALLDKGLDRMEACVNGTKEVAIPVLTSTLTTVGAFIPLLLINSIIGEYIKSLPQIIMISLFFSYLVAILVTPTLAYVFLKKSKNSDKSSLARKIFSKMLTFGLRFKAVVLLLAFVGIISAVFLTTKLGLQFFPKADKDIIYVNIDSTTSSGLLKTEELTTEISEILNNQPEIIEYTTAIGNGLPKFWDTMFVSSPSLDFAQMLVRLDLSKGNRFNNNSEFSDFLQSEFDLNISSGTAVVKQLEQGQPMGAPIAVKVSGENIQNLGKIATEIKNKLNNIEGTQNVRDNFPDTISSFSIDIDTDTASINGLTKYDIQREVRIALQGQNVSSIKENGKEINIIVKSNINTKEKLENFAIKSSISGQSIPLNEVANIIIKDEIPTIVKDNRKFTVTVLSDIKSGFSSANIQQELKEEIEDIDLTEEEISFDGEQESINQNFSDVGVKSIFTIMIIFMILMIQFNSFRQPLIILLTIPLSSIGSIAGLYLSGMPLSFTGLLGIVSLFGIVVNNAIILVDFINRERKNGKSTHDACNAAVDKRFRPIMLSTTTTAIGLLPLIFMGSDLFTPMAIAIVSGLIVSTLLTLIIIPVVYSLVSSKSKEYIRVD